MARTDEAALLAVALDGCPRLQAGEKALLFDLLDLPSSLAVLSVPALERLLGRKFRGDFSWNQRESLDKAERDLELMTRSCIRFVHSGESDYPPVLIETDCPPFMLYYRGSLPDPERSAVAIVGTRFPTGAGLDEAAALGREAGVLGIQVVSGLARGIDAAAHAGTMEGGGVTFGVLGCGIDRIYPVRNSGLARRILESGGGILSEYPPGTEAHAFRFPERNRIIAGLCRATIVVEAPENSGALITAQFALDEGRDVVVSAARLEGPRSKGCVRLLEDGARPVHGLEQALDATSVSSRDDDL